VEAVKDISEAQFRFRKAKGTRDVIDVLRTIAERILKCNRMFMCVSLITRRLLIESTGRS